VKINTKNMEICFLRFSFEEPMSPLRGSLRMGLFNPFPLSNDYGDRSSFLHFNGDTKSHKDLHTKQRLCLALQLENKVGKKKETREQEHKNLSTT
jgi:hypothetical protein